MLDHDLVLTDHDLAGLTDRATVATLFARLGYTTERGYLTDPIAEGFPERLAEAVKYLEVVAVDDLDLVTVYLIELASVTVARIKELATHFKQRAGDTLAVLTSSYERIDFVLFDQQPATEAQRQAQVVPRRLTLQRRPADINRQTVVRRALNRFSWTEPDGLGQWEKLRSAFAIGEWSEPWFDNRALFSDYFLTTRLRERDEWAASDGLRSGLQGLRVAMLTARHAFQPEGEGPLRGGLIEPLLAHLGYQARALKPADSPEHGVPDYELCDPASGAVLGACLTYHWDRFLDGPASNPDDPTADENPGAAVLSVLERQGLDWALVTNGKHWRWYTSQTPSRASNWFQIDLEEAAADSDPTALKYFWLLFRAAALQRRAVVVEGEERSLNFLEELLAGSRSYARGIEDRLKRRVFEDIFPILAEGFIVSLQAQGIAPDPAVRKQVFDATLTLLYRLLFLLYAESRDLLPVRDPGGYWEHSLACLKAELAEAAGTVESTRDRQLAAAYSASSTALWERLRDLFAVIDRGDAALNVPPYNGGLFSTDPQETGNDREAATARFLNQQSLSDWHLARALDRLARDPDEKTHGLAPIDYKSLGVRQLGSIYEGLLEYQVQVEVEGDALREVYLANQKMERKAAGAYYTPAEIVTYIVERTVSPVLDRKLAALRDQLDAACRARHRAAKSPAAGGPDLSPGDQELVERLFDFRVIDPAMGSGHFLVATVDLIADRLIDFLNGFPGNPVERLLAATRAEIVAGVAKHGVIVDQGKLVDVNLLKRHVLKRCIFGVDLNPMAVELAKVSLWLHCFTLGAPLSFLGHHLKQGNSLVGEVSADQVVAPGSTRFGQLQQAIGRYLSVSHRADVSAAEVKQSRVDYRAAELILEPDRQRAHIETARYFEGWNSATVGYAQQIAEGKSQPGYQAEYETAQQHAAQHAFFHWPLEFPEIWFEPRSHDGKVYRAKEQPGFDAVVGNPPWERTKLQEAEFFAGRSREVMTATTAAARKRVIAQLPQTDPALWQEYQSALAGVAGFGRYVRSSNRYPTMRSGDTNLYQLFAESALAAVAPTGRFGLVVPSGIATDYSNRHFFGSLVQRRAVAEILDFENRGGRIFRDVHQQFKIIVLIGAGEAAEVDSIRCAFFLHAVEEASQPERVVQLRRDDFALLNPNTLTCPVLRSQRDADLLHRIYTSFPVMLRDSANGEANPWGVRYVRQFDMANSSDLFEPAPAADLLPLYEGKMLHQFDHRFASVTGSVSTDLNIGAGVDTTLAQHADPGFAAVPRHWVPAAEVDRRLAGWDAPYVLAFRDIARAADARTAIAAICPRVGFGHTAPLLLHAGDARDSAFLVAWLNSFANDYVLRLKLSSTHLAWFILQQQPIPTRAQVTAVGAGGDSLGWVAQRVLQLSYTAHDLAGFAAALGHTGPPFAWDEERRLHLRCQLDAFFCHLYGLTPDEVDYLLETFWIVRRNEEKRWGEYRSKKLIQEYWQKYEGGEWGR